MAKFKTGQSGNPSGRPKGILDRRTELRKQLGEHSQAVIKRVVDACLIDGDMTACKIIVDRIVSQLKPKAEPVTFEIDTSQPLTQQAASVLQAVAAGELDPMTGKAIIDTIAGLSRVTEIDELTTRLNKLEEATNENR